MKRLIPTLVLVGALTALPAGTGWARGDGWQPLPAEPSSFSACRTHVHVEFPRDKEYVKYISLPDSVTEVKVTGRFLVKLTNLRTGVSVLENASGPGRSLAFPDGTFEFVSQGLNIFLGSISPDLPDIFITRGAVDVSFLPDGTVQINKMNPNVIDVCALLT